MRDSGRKLGGAAEHLIVDSEKRICQLSFEFLSPRVMERRSNIKFNDVLAFLYSLCKEVGLFITMTATEQL